MAQIRSAHRLFLPALLVLLAGCEGLGDRSPLSPTGEPGFATVASATLLECPLDQAASATGTIDALGGTLRVTDSAGGTHEVVFPHDAVSLPTLFQLTVPASQRVAVRVSALDPITGALRSIGFPADAQPILAISYKRCTNGVPHDLRLYHTDEETGAVLEGPFGRREGDPADPRVEGRVPHFSEYAVGSPD